MLKNLPAMQETQVQSLGWEDPLAKRGRTKYKRKREKRVRDGDLS